MELINRIYKVPLIESLFHTLTYCLKNELSDCRSVLDLGCGQSSPLKYCKNIDYSVGVEAFLPYFEKTKSRGIHNEYLNKQIGEVEFAPKSFDAVIMIEVIEHMPHDEALEIMKKAETWARKKVVISTPNGFFKQDVVDKNLFQKHLSGWSNEDMRKRGYSCRGLAGLKILRSDVKMETIESDLSVSIRFRPKLLWFIISALSQVFTYYFPFLAFGIFCVKKIK